MLKRKKNYHPKSLMRLTQCAKVCTRRRGCKGEEGRARECAANWTSRGGPRLIVEEECNVTTYTIAGAQRMSMRGGGPHYRIGEYVENGRGEDRGSALNTPASEVCTDARSEEHEEKRYGGEIMSLLLLGLVVALYSVAAPVGFPKNQWAKLIPACTCRGALDSVTAVRSSRGMASDGVDSVHENSIKRQRSANGRTRKRRSSNRPVIGHAPRKAGRKQQVLLRCSRMALQEWKLSSRISREVNGAM
ncbi:hypothetical protein EDB85DRAFT_1895536 [Lactarius pseudohatsudake]|nr:hypothetical protein EDB85DRAFT_1895536 [Lactarius pseudohatsudake]